MSKYNIEVTSEEIEELMKNVEQKVPISTGWFNPIKKKLALIEPNMPNLESILCVNKVRHKPDHSEKAKLLVLYCRCKACPKLKYIVSLINRTVLYMEVLKSGEHEFENHDKDFKSRNKRQRVDANGQGDLKSDESVHDYYQNEANCTDFDGESCLDFDEDEDHLEPDSSMLYMSNQLVSGMQREDVIQHITESNQSIIMKSPFIGTMSNSVYERDQVEQMNGNKSHNTSSFNQPSAESSKMHACCIEFDAKIEGDLALRFSDRVKLIHTGEEYSLVRNVLTDKCGYVPKRCIQPLDKFLDNIQLCQKKIAKMSN